MIEKAAIPIDLLDKDKSPALVQAWFEIVHLKQLYRQGWLERGIEPEFCETVAEHTFGNAMLCLLLVDRHPELDSHRVLRLALVHDLGEAYVGDITPKQGVAKHEKSTRERAAVEKILGKLPGGDRLVADWHEYEAQDTPEARFVKQVDRLELALQASVYEHQGKVDATEFFEAANAHLTSDVLKEILATLRRLASG